MPDNDTYSTYAYDNSDPSKPLLPGPGDGKMDRSFASIYTRRRRQTRMWLSSRSKHYLIMGLVAVDVTVILADIFIGLVACDLHKQEEPWVEHAREGLHIVALVFSSLFLAELLVAVWAFGHRFFYEWFHCFDAFVIVASFVIDVLTKGVLEEIASMVIVLRLWRFVKIVEELGMGASERMEEMEGRMVDLEGENQDLKMQLEALRRSDAESRGEA